MTLRVSFDQALRRVQADSMRKPSSLSRDPAFLATNHADFAARFSAASTANLVLDTETMSAVRLAGDLLRTPYLAQHRRDPS